MISFFRSHVGQTVYMQTVSGNTFRRKPFKFSQEGILHLHYPYCYRCHFHKEYPSCGATCADQIHDYLHYSTTGNVACLIIEPILGNGGNVIPPVEYFQKLRKICTEEEIVLIFDEIQTGMGRTGQMFAAQTFGVNPDIMTVAKGLGGSGFQIAAILMEERFNKMKAHYHSFTYGSNVMSCAAASKTIDIISREGFLENVRTTGNYFMQELEKLKEKYSFIGDVRGVGLMIGVEIVKSKATKLPDVPLTNAIASKAAQNGLLLRTSLYGMGNVFKIRPALNITMEECEKLISILDKTLEEFKS